MTILATIAAILVSIVAIIRAFNKPTEEKIDNAKAGIDDSIKRADDTGRP